MKVVKFIATFSVLSQLTFASLNLLAADVVDAVEHGDRNSAEYNPAYKALALEGYDPVSYHPEGGAMPIKGSSSFEVKYGDVLYRFVNQDNLDTFLANPLKYESTYGGWCAWAMVSGTKIDVNPLIYTRTDSLGNIVADNEEATRIHYFISNRAKRNFDRNAASFETRADDNWRSISGEEPRLQSFSA